MISVHREIKIIMFIYILSFIHYLSLTSPISTITWLKPPRPYRDTTRRERELTLDHIHTFLTTQGHGRPPRIRDQLNAGAISETTRTWKDDYDGQMIFGELVELLTFVLQMRKTPIKTSPRKLVPTGGRTRARCVTGAHATTCSTAVSY